MNIDIADRAPKLRRMKPGPLAKVTVTYSIIPARAVWELCDRPHLLRTLAALCLHTSPLGIAYPSQKRLAAICKRSEAVLSVQLRQLEARGFIRRLVSKSKRTTRHAIRRQVLYDVDAPIPPKETLGEPGIFVPAWNYPFNDGREAEHRGAEKMMVTTTRKVDAPVTQEELGRQQYALEVAEQKLDAESTRLASYFSKKYGERMRAQTQPAVSVQTARKWLKRGFTFDELRVHVDLVVDEVPKDERLPCSLADYREPQR